jgi:nucleoid DNA-binding protein
MTKNKDEIIYKLATKYNLPISKVEEIVTFQFKFVTNIMKQGNFDPIRLPYFGKFSAKKERIKYINKLKNETKR